LGLAEPIFWAKGQFLSIVGMAWGIRISVGLRAAPADERSVPAPIESVRKSVSEAASSTTQEIYTASE